jgi:hypothetical protein
MILTAENQRIRRKNGHSTIFSTTNSTWTGLCAKAGLRGENLVTNRLSYGTAMLNGKSDRNVSKDKNVCFKQPVTGLVISSAECSKVYTIQIYFLSR